MGNDIKKQLEKPLTKEKAIELLNSLNGFDKEDNHILADEILLNLINDKQIEEAYRNIEKWYS